MERGISIDTDRLRDLRRGERMTQPQMAALLGVSAGHYAAVETGRVTPGLGLVRRMEHRWGTRIELDAAVTS